MQTPSIVRLSGVFFMMTLLGLWLSPARTAPVLAQTGSADLRLTMSGSAKALVGAQLSYGLTLANLGPSGATNISLSDSLPSTVRFMAAASSVGTCTQVDGSVSCSLGALAAGSSASVTVTAVAITTGTATNQASVTSDTADPNTANNTSALTTQITLAIGDVDHDGKVNAVDALCLLRFVAQLPATTACQFRPDRPTDPTWNVNSDQQINAVDALCILRSVAGLAATIPCPALSPSGAVTIVDFAFNPGTLTVPLGATVVWTNTGIRTHTVSADDGSFDGGHVAAGGMTALSFPASGSFAYHCAIHPSMHGTIVVQ